ncbi:ribonuclease III [bacterium]|nr:ribonuclease III [bacterium]
MTPDLTRLFEELPEEFKNSSEYKSALRHKSYFYESDDLGPHNERLEFLGDAALDLIVARNLFLNFPDQDEGFLTKAKSNLVNTKVLAEKAKALKLEEKILLGRSEKSDCSPRVLASCLEALIGAIYLVLGEKVLANFVSALFVEEMKSSESLMLSSSDWKSKLQEELQKDFRQTPSYELVASEGPDHLKTFQVKVHFQEQVLGFGQGLSIKEAEQAAAKEAFEKFDFAQLKKEMS